MAPEVLAGLDGTAPVPITARWSVSVVIPTTGRRELPDAVASALSQSVSPLEVVVVYDRSVGFAGIRSTSTDPRVRHVLSDARPRSAIATRLSGVRQARGDLVAHLDDDDEWLPGKLEQQLRRYAAERERVRYPLVTALPINVDPDGNVLSVAAPIGHNPMRDALGDSLFVRRRVFRPPTMIGSSSMLFDRELVDLEPIDETVDLHDDWLWMLRVDRRPDALVSIVERPLLRYRINPPGESVGTTGGPAASLDAARRMGLSPRAFGDFGLTVSAAMAAARGDRLEAVRVARIVQAESRPGLRAWCWLATMLVVPRRAVPALHGWRRQLAGLVRDLSAARTPGRARR
jgi:hypothetical protein